MIPLILASTSKYRRELLQRLNLSFDCHAPDVDESAYKNLGLSPKELASRLAYEKAMSVAKKFPDSVVIGSDQVAALDELIFDKPGSVENACAQLKEMQGKTHCLYTAVSLIVPNRDGINFIEVTKLSMRSLSQSEIERYVSADQPLDCAGSYKIETLGVSLFNSIVGDDFTAITGLPLMILAKHLRAIGYELP